MGSGCPDCSVGGYSLYSTGWFYLVSMPGGVVLKFGITGDLDERLRVHSSQGFTEVVETIFFESAADARDAEGCLRQHARANGWKPPLTAESMPHGGASETLSVHDVGEGFTLSAFLAEHCDD